MNSNFLKLKPGLFRDNYAYIDDKVYTIDSLLIQEKIRVKFKKQDMVHPNYPNFCLSFLSCKKKDSDKIENIVFKKLDNALIIKYGSEYTQFLDKANKVLIDNGLK